MAARIVRMPRLAIISTIGTVLLLAATYLQWHTQKTCVVTLDCRAKHPTTFGPPHCEATGCGPDPWVFAAPALALGVVAVGLILLNRQRNRSAAA